MSVWDWASTTQMLTLVTINISRDDCVGLGVDSTNANIGNHKYIITRARGKTPYCCYWVPLYILHNACGNADADFFQNFW